MKSLKLLAAGSLLIGAVNPAWSQVATKRSLTLDGARQVIAAARAEADAKDAPGGVIAVVDDGGNLPRIPAARAGTELSWRNDDWRASIGATRYFRQDRTAEFETETAGFTLLNARVAWTFLETERGGWEAWLDGSNLANQTARLSTSLIKDQAPLAGRSVSIGIRGMF